MSVILNEADEIYFSKTREYFQEVISSYSIGNYRSATVMLYSVAVCDILFKLNELKDMYNDTVATDILEKVEKSRNSYDNKSKSKWEKELIDDIHKRTALLDLEAYTNLNHLYDHRNFSAHPVLNDNYELVAPSKETTIANIKNILNNILIKPPIFIKNIVDTLTEDLKDKKDIYKGEDEKLALYLNNKYYSKMSKPMKIKTMTALWKFCFNLSDEDCRLNRFINRKALEILITSFQQEAIEHIKSNSEQFPVAVDKECRFNLSVLLSVFPQLYGILNEDVQVQIDNLVKEESIAQAIAWFKYKTATEHIEYLKTRFFFTTLSFEGIKAMVSHYSSVGEMTQLLDFFVWYYGQSDSYDIANSRFEIVIEPFLDKMSAEHFKQIIENTNQNDQIYGRRAAYYSNNKIMKYAKNILDKDFNYSEYDNFSFDTEILSSDENTDLFKDIPF